jgi:hypothetical protein
LSVSTFCILPLSINILFQMLLGNDIQYQRYSLCYTAFVSCQIKSINILFRVILQPTYTNQEKDYNCTCGTWGGGDTCKKIQVKKVHYCPLLILNDFFRNYTQTHNFLS